MTSHNIMAALLLLELAAVRDVSPSASAMSYSTQAVKQAAGGARRVLSRPSGRGAEQAKWTRF